MKTIACAFCCLALLPLALPGWGQTDQRAQIARVEQGLLPDSPIVGERAWRLRDRMAYYRVPGVQLAVLQAGHLSWSRGYGVADPLTKRRVTSETCFDAGSVSKAVTSVAVMRLVDQGRLSLDTPVNNLLHSWKLPENDFTRKTPVTLRHLLSHTAGVNVGGFWGYLETDPQPTLQQILRGEPPAANGPVRVEAEPGTGWRYSGGGYVIVQQIIEDVTGKPFAQAIDELVFAPLGMTRSTFVQGLPPALRADTAVPTSDASYFKGKRLHPHAAAAGLYSTATDLARLISALYASLHPSAPGTFLRPDTARLLITPVVRDREPWDRAQPNRRNTQKDQAVGFMLMSKNGAANETVYAYHDGLNAGFRSRVMLDPQTGNGAVILYNSDGDEEFLLETTRAVAAAYDWKDYLNTPLRTTPTRTAELDRYVGRYRRSSDNVVSIRRDGNHLLWTDLWTVTQPIYPMGNGIFEHRELFGHESRFAFGPGGVVQSLDGWRRLADTPPLPVEYLLQGHLRQGADTLRTDRTLDEQRLGDIGFNLLTVQQLPRAAAAVYQVTTERYPGSSGAWDAFGDALHRAGDSVHGAAAERRATLLRDIRTRLREGFAQGGVFGGCVAYQAVRREHGSLPLGDMMERLANQLKEQGKSEEAEAITRLHTYDQRTF